MAKTRTLLENKKLLEQATHVLRVLKRCGDEDRQVKILDMIRMNLDG
jgi:hypothetical protein